MIPRQLKILLLEVAQFSWKLYNQILFIITCIYYHILSAIEQSYDACDFVTNGQLPLTDLRRPKHIALCFTNELNCLDIDSIARILYWCKQLNISYITLYDELGRLKHRQKELIQSFAKRMTFLGYEKPINHVDGLSILSRPEGRSKFVEDVRELVNLGPENMNLDIINKRVGWTTDPEMLINFGLPLCLYGFPPWPLRLTEIFSIPTHRKVPQKIFIDCLRQYSRTSQRVGT